MTYTFTTTKSVLLDISNFSQEEIWTLVSGEKIENLFLMLFSKRRIINVGLKLSLMIKVLCCF